MRIVVVGLVAALIGTGTATARPHLFDGGGDVREMLRGPAKGFAQVPPPSPPDYRNPDVWAARPGKRSAASTTPEGLAPIDPVAAKVDVFFIHPTSYMAGETWNQDLGDDAVNARTDSGSIANQASAFNGCCRIYAPRYRQAVLAAFFTRRKEDAEQALELAYEDVRAAFRTYIAQDNGGRPFIIASHSQGSRHAIRLLKDEIAGTSLAPRLVAAYVVGYAFPLDVFERNLKGIGPCLAPAQTGCVASWSTYGEGAAARWSRDVITQSYEQGDEANRGKPLACTNPLSWRADNVVAPAVLSLGAWSTRGGGTPRTGVVSARCAGGVLYADFDAGLFGGAGERRVDNFHMLDYQLFYLNIRSNAIERSQAYLSARGQ